MSGVRRFSALAAGLVSLVTAGPALACEFAGEAPRWTAEALAAWDRLDRERLHTPQSVAPIITLYDDACVHRLTPEPAGAFVVGARAYSLRSAPHDGIVELPGGGAIPARRLAMAYPLDQDMAFVMALPPLWRANTEEPRDPDLLAMVVFMHEFAHTQQGDSLGPRIDALVAAGLPSEIDDDLIQKRFAGVADYANAWAQERDLFYAAAFAPDRDASHRLASQGAALMQARRSRWLDGDDGLLAAADDVFLTFEGAGNWAAWIWLTDPRGGGLDTAEAAEFIRGRRTFWSQDQGLAVMLTLERLLPDWPARAFGSPAVTIETLLADALKEADPRVAAS